MDPERSRITAMRVASGALLAPLLFGMAVVSLMIIVPSSNFRILQLPAALVSTSPALDARLKIHNRIRTQRVGKARQSAKRHVPLATQTLCDISAGFSHPACEFGFTYA
jgi:hypothetical protein